MTLSMPTHASSSTSTHNGNGASPARGVLSDCGERLASVSSVSSDDDGDSPHNIASRIRVPMHWLNAVQDMLERRAPTRLPTARNNCVFTSSTDARSANGRSSHVLRVITQIIAVSSHTHTSTDDSECAASARNSFAASCQLRTL
jgi:hypothetical protein